MPGKSSSSSKIHGCHRTKGIAHPEEFQCLCRQHKSMKSVHPPMIQRVPTWCSCQHENENQAALAKCYVYGTCVHIDTAQCSHGTLEFQKLRTNRSGAHPH